MNETFSGDDVAKLATERNKSDERRIGGAVSTATRDQNRLRVAEAVMRTLRPHVWFDGSIERVRFLVLPGDRFTVRMSPKLKKIVCENDSNKTFGFRKFVQKIFPKSYTFSNDYPQVSGPNSMTTLYQLPYSLYLPPSDLFLFLKCKMDMIEGHWDNVETIKGETMRQLKMLNLDLKAWSSKYGLKTAKEDWTNVLLQTRINLDGKILLNPEFVKIHVL
ncbi:hypothetical protein AVEN_60460-1 [Araneus ventricosus]|uniref:Uncharacterized protein n=1 Tax=Araneus ventricosus TaxID=182803 RepID=A0A4Y2KA80_ARAVE|nr:hypothetical protein AVEN_60460-1 [Araneus ventricosus]